jgi:hypothetical protein
LRGYGIFTHLSDRNDEFPLQLTSLASALASHLPDIRADAVVVRSIDWSRFMKSGLLQKRYCVEGVLLATARHRVELTIALDGHDIGRRAGSTKEVVEAEAANIFDQKLVEAGTAALAALRLAEARC